MWIPLALCVLAAALAWLAWELSGLRRAAASAQSLALLQQQVEALRAQVQQSLSEGLGQQVQLQQHLQGTLQGVEGTTRQVSAQLATLQASGARMEELGKSLASLQEILRPSKQRGELGEEMLSNLLDQVLPKEHVVYQHAFRSGARVDAVVRTPQGLVPIDAKFPIESFQRLLKAPAEERPRAVTEFRRSLKARIDEIADKYVCPDEGTLDFAFLYVPAEGVYYEMAVDRDHAELMAYARSRRVIPVSPGTLFAFLQTVLIGLKGMRIEAEAKTIRESLARLQGDLQKALAKSAVLGGHLKNAAQNHQELHRDLGGLSERLGAQLHS